MNAILILCWKLSLSRNSSTRLITFISHLLAHFIALSWIMRLGYPTRKSRRWAMLYSDFPHQKEHHSIFFGSNIFSELTYRRNKIECFCIHHKIQKLRRLRFLFTSNTFQSRSIQVYVCISNFIFSTSSDRFSIVNIFVWKQFGCVHWFHFYFSVLFWFNFLHQF